MPKLTLFKPLITEKSMRLAQVGQFTFSVDKAATKPAVAAAVEEQFKVNVIKVATTKVKGKDRRTGKRRLWSGGQEQKKAVITLKKGETIEYFKIPKNPKLPKKPKS